MAVSHLFAGWEETLIFSCLQGIMGDIYVPADVGGPESAAAYLGDFAFFAGIPSRELVLHRPDSHKQNFIIMVPQNEAWSRLLEECYGERAYRVSRYAIKKEPLIFNRTELQRNLLALPNDCELRLIEEELYLKCLSQDWSRDLVSQFANYETYRRLGLGAVIVKAGEIISGASSYSRYKEGIEIEIDTKEPYRRKGFAFICASRLILECLDRGLYPSWDAQNIWSVALAEKLGYHYSHTYPAYEIRNAD